MEDDWPGERPPHAGRHAAEDGLERSRVRAELVAMRKAAGLSQRALAIRMGTQQSAVSDFENASGDFHLSTAQRYARAVAGRLRLVLEVPGE